MVEFSDWIWVIVVGVGALALGVAMAYGTRMTRRRRAGPPPGREVSDSGPPAGR
jgi:hypothetical protein